MANTDYITDPRLYTKADFKTRLINFKIGEAGLTSVEHQAWLRDVAQKTNTSREFTCHIYGFASKKEKPLANLRLSYDRANTAAKFLEKLNPLYTSRIDHFSAEGDAYKSMSEDDNDPYYRAVEVHVFLSGVPAAPPPNVTPAAPLVIRTGLQWSIAGSGLGVQSNPVDWLPAQVALSMFVFRNDETSESGNFIAPMFGAGMDAIGLAQAIVKGLKGSSKLMSIVGGRLGKLVEFDDWLVELGLRLSRNEVSEFYKNLIKGLTSFALLDTSFTPTQFSKAKVFIPLTMGKIDGATIANLAVTVNQSNYGSTYVYGQTWYTEDSGNRMFARRDFLEVPASWSTQYQFPNVGASFLGGPLIRL
jgi:hypothetical protein